MRGIMADIFDIFKKLEAERKTAQTQPITHLLVGLGNPGKQYTYTLTLADTRLTYTTGISNWNNRE